MADKLAGRQIKLDLPDMSKMLSWVLPSPVMYEARMYLAGLPQILQSPLVRRTRYFWLLTERKSA